MKKAKQFLAFMLVLCMVIGGIPIHTLAINTENLPKAEGVNPVSDTKGDFNNDGEASNADVIMLARYLVHIVVFEDWQVRRADFNSDGKVSNSDLVSLARWIVGLEDNPQITELEESFNDYFKLCNSIKSIESTFLNDEEYVSDDKAEDVICEIYRIRRMEARDTRLIDKHEGTLIKIG